VGIQPQDKNRIRAICFAPPRVISRNHVVNYSHAIRAVVLQDDFFSRVDTSVVQHIFLGFTCIGYESFDDSSGFYDLVSATCHTTL
jgi:hypothetical protein